MSDKSESFEEWLGRSGYGEKDFLKHKEYYLPLLNAYNAGKSEQQKKIDELKKDKEELVRHGFMLVEQKRSAIEKLQSAEEENNILVEKNRYLEICRNHYERFSFSSSEVAINTRLKIETLEKVGGGE